MSMRHICFLLGSALVLHACGSDDSGESADASSSSTSSETGDASTTASDASEASSTDSSSGDGDATGDGDGDTTGDGDGDSSGDGDGDTSGDGDGDTSGDGDGDSSGDGDGDTSGDGDGDSSGDGDGDTGGDGDGDGDTGGDGDGDGDGDQDCSACAENTDLIYVLSDDAELWSFDPATNMFALVGDLNCGVSALTGTFSMSVSRAGIAWIMYQDGQMYQVDVNDPASCTNSGWSSTSDFELFGMGFVSNSLADPCEKLYAHSWSGFGGFSEGLNAGNLGAIDPLDLSVSVQGPINYDGGELTGTGDGRLFAFAGANPAKLIEYDKSDASEVQTTPLVGLDLTNAFAFAHYDGDFFFFTEEGLGTTSKVTYYAPTNPGVFTQVASAPIRIVGAGVSTCAPLPE